MRRYRITVNDNVYDVEVEEVHDGQLPGDQSDGEPGRSEGTGTKEHIVEAAQTRDGEKLPGKGPGEALRSEPGEGTQVRAPLTGTILSVEVEVGGSVRKGDVLISLEALKMENEIQSPVDGTVSYVGVAEGQDVQAGAVLMVIRQ